MAIWGDSNNSSLDYEEEEEERIANLCLMSHNNEVNIENSFEFTFEELLEAFYELVDNLKRIMLKNKDLRKSNLLLAK